MLINLIIIAIVFSFIVFAIVFNAIVIAHLVPIRLITTVCTIPHPITNVIFGNTFTVLTFPFPYRAWSGCRGFGLRVWVYWPVFLNNKDDIIIILSLINISLLWIVQSSTLFLIIFNILISPVLAQSRLPGARTWNTRIASGATVGCMI